MMGSKIMTFGIIAATVAVSIVIITANLSEFAFAQNKTSNMSKAGGNMTSATSTNKTSFAGASNPTMAGKIANATKSHVPNMTKTITSGLSNMTKTVTSGLSNMTKTVTSGLSNMTGSKMSKTMNMTAGGGNMSKK
jgi:hypothetical protein